MLNSHQNSDELHAVAIQPLNQAAQDIIDEITSHPFSTHTNGKFTLEILIDVWEEDQQRGIFSAILT